MTESFEAEVNQQLNDARDKSGNIALEDLSNANRLRNMVQAGSKGNNKTQKRLLHSHPPTKI